MTKISGNQTSNYISNTAETTSQQPTKAESVVVSTPSAADVARTTQGAKQIAQQNSGVQNLQAAFRQNELKNQLSAIEIGNDGRVAAAKDQTLIQQGQELGAGLANAEQAASAKEQAAERNKQLNDALRGAGIPLAGRSDAGSSVFGFKSGQNAEGGQGGLLGSGIDAPGFEQDSPLTRRTDLSSVITQHSEPDNFNEIVYNMHGITITKNTLTGEREATGGAVYSKTKDEEVRINNQGRGVLIRHNADGSVTAGPVDKIRAQEAEARKKAAEEKLKPKSRPSDNALDFSGQTIASLGSRQTTGGLVGPQENTPDFDVAKFAAKTIAGFNSNVNPNPNSDPHPRGPIGPPPDPGIVDPPKEPEKLERSPRPKNGPIRPPRGPIPRAELESSSPSADQRIGQDSVPGDSITSGD